MLYVFEFKLANAFSSCDFEFEIAIHKCNGRAAIFKDGWFEMHILLLFDIIK